MKIGRDLWTRGLHESRVHAAFLRGTLAPDRRASDNPIAIACFGFVTFRPLPDFSLPRLNSCISRSTDCDAFGPYFLPLDFFFDDEELEPRVERDEDPPRLLDEERERLDDFFELPRDEEVRDLPLLFFEDELERDFLVAAIRFSLLTFQTHLP